MNSSKPEAATAEARLAAAVAQLRHLKSEHRPILQQLIDDPGMAASTRWALVDHLLAEEEESVEALWALVGGESTSGAISYTVDTPDATLAVEAEARVGGAWTVGPLRQERGDAAQVSDEAQRTKA